MQAHVAFRVLWFTTIKACINTAMVMTGWKKSGVFKVTPKLGETAEESDMDSTHLPDTVMSGSGSSSTSKAEKATFKFRLHHVHDVLSKVCVNCLLVHL
jgi:hypothetical protein